MFASRSAVSLPGWCEPARVEFFSSIASQRFRHDGEIPKSFATWAIEASESL
jgi:hypothetical protein